MGLGGQKVLPQASNKKKLTNPSGSSIISAHALSADVVVVGVVRLFFVDVLLLSVGIGRLLVLEGAA